jgi:phosphoglucosamine mutase
MKPYPQVIVSVDVRDKKPIEKMPAVARKIAEIKARLKDNGRVLVRYSGTQNCCRIMVEGKDAEAVKKAVHEIAAAITKQVGK